MAAGVATSRATGRLRFGVHYDIETRGGQSGSGGVQA